MKRSAWTSQANTNIQLKMLNNLVKWYDTIRLNNIQNEYFRRSNLKADSQCSNHQHKVPHVACSNVLQLDTTSSQCQSLNDATGTHQEIFAFNPAYYNVSNPVESQQSTYTTLDFQNTENIDYQEIST